MTLGAPPTLVQLQSLYNATKTASSRFASYNFRQYFIHRTDELFSPIMSAVDPNPGATPSQTPDLNLLTRFYDERSRELSVLRRASEVNRLFEGPKLVVEHPRPITSGGGAGMEASAGGGGQPV